MIRGVPRTNPPAPPPFTYNPRRLYATPPESVHNSSPVFPGAGTIPPATQPQPNRAASKKTTKAGLEMNGVVPTQPILQKVFDEDDFGFLDSDVSYTMFGPELTNVPSDRIANGDRDLGIGRLNRMNSTDMPLAGDFVQPDVFVQGSVGFNEIEEVISPEVSGCKPSLLTFNVY
jgi:hypothetical protein